MQGVILAMTVSASISVWWVGWMSDMLNFTSRKWGWVLKGLSCFCHSSHFSLQLWFLLSVIAPCSCCRHGCCHALRIPLSTWVRKGAKMIVLQCQHYPSRLKKIVTDRVANVVLIQKLDSEVKLDELFCIQVRFYVFINCKVQCGSWDFMLFHHIWFSTFSRYRRQLLARSWAWCVVVALSGLLFWQSYVTEIVSREVSCSASMFSVFLLSLVNQNPARIQAFPLEYCTVARWWTCFILNVTVFNILADQCLFFLLKTQRIHFVFLLA